MTIFNHKNNHRIILFILGIFLFTTSCSLHFEKRRYRPGYHVEVMNPDKNVHHKRENTEKPVELVKNKFVSISASKDSLPITKIPHQSLSHNKIEKKSIKHVSIPKKHVLDNDSCDVVYMATGERINAIVIEIGEDYVHYKKCDDPKGRLYTVKTKTIDNITLRNGEYFIPKDRKIVDKDKEKRKSNTLFIMSIIAGGFAVIALVLSFFIYPASIVAFMLAFFDIIFTFILMMINIRPTRYVPSYRTKFTWIITAIVILLLIAAFIIMFA